MKRITVLVLLLMAALSIGLGHAPDASAEIFDADSEVTYKEYWMNHSQFTGGCLNGLPTNPSGTTYVEPGKLNECSKAMQILLPDNFASALKAEIYLDLWRNYDDQSARFRINNSPTVYAPNVGENWSRTPWVSEIPLQSLNQGTNTFTFWANGGLYHIHDIAIRIYYDDAHPLIPPVGGDTTPPDGELVSITSQDDGLEIPAYDGGMLLVNNDTLTLKANVEPGAKYVEFHAYYDGYDDDNDGAFRDWHSISRNNWWPGGKEAGAHPNGGTANHIGTVNAPAGGGTVTKVWDLKHIINQPGVRFKIRVVDAAGNVREGAGGITPEYSLVRYYPVVYYTLPGFRDTSLHMSGTQNDTAAYTFPLPADLNLNEYSEVYLLGMYWKRPRFSFNGMAPQSVQNGNNDEWTLGIKPVSKTLLKAGNNSLVYSYSGSGVGHFVEKPGPMLVLRGNISFTPDNGIPYIAGRNPAANASNVNIFSTVSARISDLGSGVDVDSIIMSVNGVQVEPVISGPTNDLTVSYTPPANQPFPFLTEIPVTVYACDLMGNCMISADTYSFMTEPPDLTPPVISNINVVTTDNTAIVNWTTNEPADSKIEYGLTQAYEKPVVSDSTLVTQHTLQLTGLQSQSTYNYRLTSRDFNNNDAVTANLTFQTKNAPGPIVSDDFSGCVINSAVWSYINPLGDSPLVWTGTGAQISVPDGVGHDLWKTGLNSPRLMQNVTNQDFDVEVKFDLPLSKKTMSVGILAQQDETNYLRFNFQSEGPITTLVVVNSLNNNPTVVFTTEVTLSGASYLRLNRAGDIWNLQYSTNGVDWTFATSYNRALTLTQIGPFVGNTGTNPAHVNVIDYFLNLNGSKTDVDAPIQLNLTQVGQGTVALEPDKDAYACNETVTLTAVPATDWAFQGWSGALSGTDQVETLTMVKSENVTATFVNDTLYTMNVNVVSNGPGVGGTVTKSPDAPSYLYGTEVELTAEPTPGWSFLGWSGDWTATELETTVPITGNMDITATFEEDAYTLETLIIAEGVGSGGTLTVDPVKDTYLYGEPVTLTVTVEEGWTFVGWEGQGVSGDDLVLNLSMSQDVVAIARLVQNQYELDINLVHQGEPGAIGGDVLKTPNLPTFGHGQVVTVTAALQPGWIFGGWAGDLTGIESTRMLTMTADKVITATFVQQHYTVTVTIDGPGHVQITPDKPYYLLNDIVTLTPVADPGYEFALWTGDLTGTQEPAILAIDKDYNIEAHFVVDTTPIEIFNPAVAVLPGGTLATVTWNTDVPGTSAVEYGESILYEAGTKTDDDLVTDHSILLSGLTPETFYHYRISSVDEFGNEVQTEDLTFTTGSSSGIFSDDFSACTLDDRWTWVNPLNDSSQTVSGRQLEITVPGDEAHSLWTNGITVPRIMQPSNDDNFTIDVKFDSALSSIGATQGIVIEEDADTFIRLEFFKRQADETNVYVAAIRDLQQPTGSLFKNFRAQAVPTEMYMRVVRNGNNWEQWYSFNGVDWVMNHQFSFEMTVRRVGVYAGNSKFAGSPLPTHTAVVDYFVNTAAPIVNEDGRYTLEVGVEGAGTVTRNPNRPGYYCGQEVTLTATPVSGWIFVGWTGDLSGTAAQRQITITEDMSVTAQFVSGQDGFEISVPIILR